MQQDLKKILRTTPKYIQLLEANNIKSSKDLLQYFPRTYENREEILNLWQIPTSIDKRVSVKWYITEKKLFKRWSKTIYTIKFQDELSNIWEISIYNSWFLASKIEKDKTYIIIWKPNFKFWKFVFSHPDVMPAENFESNEDLKTNSSHHYKTWRIYPIYSELNWIKPTWFAEKIWKILPYIEQDFSEYLPTEFLKEFHLLDVQTTIKNMHYPKTMEMKDKASYRVFFDRLLRIQLYSLINKQEYQKWKIIKNEVQIDRDVVKEIIAKLPFELTNAQKRVIKDIIENLHDTKPMLRLLQWDVGSGKTIVAAISAYYIHQKFQGQTTFVAPLWVLAEQHFKTLAKLFLPLWLRVELLTGSTTKSEKDNIKRKLKEWKIDVLVWTHAILQDDVHFHNLQLAVVDEQHKFWVKQRWFFNKFWSPHILQMTATPIPRSMALAFFGEFDVSIIDELPAGRKPIHTKIISENEYRKMKPWVLTRIDQWQKVFIVTPLIEDSEKMDEIKSALSEFEETRAWLHEISDQIWLLHWKMKHQEKKEIMQDFKSWKYSVLISTTVIEVWIDIPEATVMVIKNSERFWLSQLHQLRGRIWRNDLQSYCFLETPKKSWDTYTRLKNMEFTSDWFKLAEIDLQNRGAWEILWTQQSGETDIPMEILTDMKFLQAVRDGANWLLEKYPNLDWLWNLKEQLHIKVGGNWV